MSPIRTTGKRNGPDIISREDGESVVIVDSDGHVLTPEAGRFIALCRRGESSAKPFRDGSHNCRTALDDTHGTSAMATHSRADE
jgi:CDGSH-type Zn-finger protein